MSVLLALAIIVAIIAVAIRRNNNVKAAAVVATTEVVTANAAVATTEVVTANAAASVAHTQDVCDNIHCTEALVMVLMYTKISLKANRLQGRRARSHAAHKAACARSHAAYAAGEEKRKEITMRDQQRALGRAAQKALVREAQAQGIGVAKLLARRAQGAAQRAANAARKQAATHGGKKATANRHVAPRGIVSITADGHKVIKVAVAPVAPAAPVAKVVRPSKARTYVRQAANKPVIISGTQLAEQARTAGTNLATQIRVAKATLESLYAMLPLARQVVALQNKADRKIGMYTWLADEGHVGVRSTKASIARRDAAQEVVCQATLAAEAFKEAYGIEAQDVVSQILAVKAAKARAVEMLRNHKAEQHRLFIERQERRAAKAAFRASKAAPAAAKTVTEVADWKEYVAANSGNKSIAFGILHAKGSTMAEKISAAIAIVGASHEDGLVSCQTADAAYMVAA